MSQTFTPPTLAEIQAEEAHMLRDRAMGSAKSVFVLIGVIAISLASVHLYEEALIWTGLASAMVAVTIFYARSWSQSEGTANQVSRYLMGHVVISSCTGLLWSFGAMQLASPSSELQTFLAGLFLTSITAGGVMAGTVYRPGYVSLALCSLLPFGLYLLIAMDGVQRIYGGFILFYLTFCIATNKTASKKTREAIGAKLISRQAEEALEEFADASRLHRATKRSVEAIQHDMAQPLLALRNFLAELDRQASSPQQAILARQIRLALVSQEALVEELANVERPPLDPIRSEVDVAEMLAQLDDEYQPQFATQNCKFSIESEVSAVVSDRAKLERILRNFLSNAVKYGASGGLVTLSVQSDDHESRWHVADQGPGMSLDQVHAILTENGPKPSDNGSGLGLGIAQHLAQELGGSIALSSTPELGTTISLHLPHVETFDTYEQAFVMCIGHATLPNMGAWADLVSSWVWEFAQANTCDEAKHLIEVLGQTPDLIVLDPPGSHQIPSEDISALKQLAPVIRFVRETPELPSHMPPGSVILPKNERDLRRALEQALQNNANSRAL
ncbi:ATP-binding protein [Shimia sediminis]|uniref:ATP-binding protein n=1 Tax=Shimia sediminis TaxID=2497945 RepID=UPI0013E0A081|nr:ATP-binding protein [Shimia sediminis]